ncbi:unnamed protein product, partial [Amoebophrya sp. A25]|eukprot:GSA25T00010880001.1
MKQPCSRSMSSIPLPHLAWLEDGLPLLHSSCAGSPRSNDVIAGTTPSFKAEMEKHNTTRPNIAETKCLSKSSHRGGVCR